MDAATLHRSKPEMEEKARLYASMKRGDYVPPSNSGVNKEENALEDFDRKWAKDQEAGCDTNYETSSDDGGDSEEEEEEIIEYEDEFGRQRRGTRAEAAREQRRRKAQEDAKEELSNFFARPDRPDNLIVGDTIQSATFNPNAPIATQMENSARKRDRSIVSSEEVYYNASKEVKSKGVGFYTFSRDTEGRKKKMKTLKRKREETERGRKEREEWKENRRREVGERKKAIKKKKGEKLAERFLDRLDGL